MQLRSTLGLVEGYLPAPAWHCTFYTPAGRQRRKLGSKNKRQAERRAREIAEFIQREDWEALSKLDWRPRPNAGSFSIFVRDEFLPGDVAPGDLLAVPGTGAYCRSMASNYNHALRPPVLNREGTSAEEW